MNANRRWLTLILLSAVALGASAVSLTGCEDKKDDAEEAPAKAEAIEVIQGDKPGWPAEIEGLAFGDPLSKLDELDFERSRTGALNSNKYEGIRYRLDSDEPDGTTIDSLSISFSDDPEDLAGKLTAAWGEPTKFKSLATEYLVWFNPEAGLRARIQAEDPGWINIERYTPLADFIGTEPGPLAFEKDKPLLGKTLEEIGQAWGDQVDPDKNDQLELPPLDTEVVRTVIFLDAEEGAPVHQYRFDIAAPADQQQAVRDLLEAKFGAPETGKHQIDGEVSIYSVPDQQMRLLVSQEDPNLDEGFNVEVQRYLPLEAIIGADKSKLAIEGDATWLGTPEADWKSNVANDGTRLKLAPTAFGDSATRVAPKFVDGKVAGYELDLRCDLRPENCTQIAEAFKKAFGEPTTERDVLQKEVLVFNNEPPIALETGTLDGYTVVVGPR